MPSLPFSFEQITNHVMYPFVAKEHRGDRIREFANEQLRRGRPDIVIQTHDPNPNDLPSPDAPFGHLAGAYLMKGDVTRAKTISEHGCDILEKAGDLKALSLALVHRGAVAWRLEGYKSAQKWLAKAIEAWPQRELAFNNQLCYASKECNLVDLKAFVAEMEARYPAWRADDLLCHTFWNDADLAWARQQHCFRAVLAQLKPRSH